MFKEKIISLTKQLYPTGRAFRFPFAGYSEGVHKALAISENKAFEDAMGILNGILPDNDSFTADDAKAWEKRLGLITNEAVSLADRKLAIQRKMNHPGTIKARQNYRYLQAQLQAAGFDVYVYENRFSDGAGGFIAKSPIQVLAEYLGGGQHGDFQMGDDQHGSSEDIAAGILLTQQSQHGTSYHGNDLHGFNYRNMIANHIDEAVDAHFNIGSHYKSLFYIGGNPLGSSANVPLVRKAEFRQLVLKIKPVQAVAFTFINYT